MSLNPILMRYLSAGQNFLIRSQLRSLRNLSLLPTISKDIVIDRLFEDFPTHNSEGEACREVIEAWIEFSETGKRNAVIRAGWHWQQYREWLNRGEQDLFGGCYFHDGTISGKGLQLRMEAGVCNNAKKF